MNDNISLFFYDDDDEVDAVVSTSSLSLAQDKALSLLPVISSLLSIWGSAHIIGAILGKVTAKTPKDTTTTVNNKHQQLSSFQRIMLGLSISDVIASVTLCLQPYLLPAATSHRVWAMGTDGTCTAMGFFQQLAFCEIWYNGMLSFYFLFTIPYAVTESRFSRRIEPWMHGLAIGVPLVSAIAGACLDMYHELVVGHFCWFTGDDTTLFAYLVAGLPMFFFVVAIPLNNLLVYCHVRQSIHHDSVTKGTTTTSTPAVVQEDVESTIKTADTPIISNAAGSEQSGETGQSSLWSSIDEPTQIQTQIQMQNNATLRDQQREQERHTSRQRRQQARIQGVAFQAFLYVASFLITHLPTTILRVTSATMHLKPYQEAQFFALLLIQAILLPLQGFFNYFIYCRPSYLRETVLLAD